MKLLKLEIKGFKRFFTNNIFNFDTALAVNSISGRNGSGKTTIADSLLLLQQSFFLTQLQERISENPFTMRAHSSFLARLNDSICATHSRIYAEFILDDGININLALIVNSERSLTWDVEISDENKEKLKELWNYENPSDVIVFIESNKHYNETDTPFSEISIATKNDLSLSREAWLTLTMIFFPKETFHLLYKNLLMDYAYDRLLPTKGKQDLYYKVASFLFKKLFPHISFSNFSLNNFKADEIVNLVSNSVTGRRKYDMRLLSSGEKTVFYLFLYLNLVGRISILIIDEPENHLHEELICKFSKLLEELSNNDKKYVDIIKDLGGDESLTNKISHFWPNGLRNKISQSFLFTHSKVLIMSLFNNGKNYILDEDGFNLLDYETCERKLREIGISSLYSKVLFVEGDQEVDLLLPLCQQNNIKIEKVGNCEKLIEIYEGIRHVQAHLHNTHFVFLLDRDVTNDERVREFINNEEFILLDRHEIENYLLDLNIWLITAQRLAVNPEDITLEEVERILKRAADGQLTTIKKLYLNNKVRSEILNFHVKVRHRDIPVDALDNFNTYIDNLLSQQEINSIKQSALQWYEESENRFSQEVWNNNWISICPGKQVVDIACTDIGRLVGCTKERFKTELLKITNAAPDSVFNQLITNIKDKLEIDN